MSIIVQFENGSVEVNTNLIKYFKTLKSCLESTEEGNNLIHSKLPGIKAEDEIKVFNIILDYYVMIDGKDIPLTKTYPKGEVVPDREIVVYNYSDEEVEYMRKFSGSMMAMIMEAANFLDCEKIKQLVAHVAVDFYIKSETIEEYLKCWEIEIDTWENFPESEKVKYENIKRIIDVKMGRTLASETKAVDGKDLLDLSNYEIKL